MAFGVKLSVTVPFALDVPAEVKVRVRPPIAWPGVALAGKPVIRGAGAVAAAVIKMVRL